MTSSCYLEGAQQPMLAAADELLAADDGFSKKGKFLIRSKGASTNDFILSVVFKGAGTHHVLARESDGAEFTLNKTPTGCTTIAEADVED